MNRSMHPSCMVQCVSPICNAVGLYRCRQEATAVNSTTFLHWNITTQQRSTKLHLTSFIRVYHCRMQLYIRSHCFWAETQIMGVRGPAPPWKYVGLGGSEYVSTHSQISHSFIQNCCWITLQVSHHEGWKTCQKWKVFLINFSTRLKQFDGLTWRTLTVWPPNFTTDLGLYATASGWKLFFLNN